MAGVVVAECGGCAGYAGAGVGGGRDGAVGARRGAGVCRERLLAPDDCDDEVLAGLLRLRDEAAGGSFGSAGACLPRRCPGGFLLGASFC